MELLNLDKVNPKVREIVSSYAEKLINLHKESVISVFAYGSVTGGNFIAGVSDINIGLILKEINFSDLKESLPLVRWGLKKRIPAPLFLTVEYINSSLDVFPMEFLEIKDTHVNIYGEDIISGINIEGKYLRLFCEQQIKGKLLRIKEVYLERGLHKKGIEAVLKDSLRSLIFVFRSLIRLKGKEPPSRKDSVLEEVCAMFNLDEEVFLSIYRDRKNDEKIKGKDIEVYFEKYLREIEKLAQAVDKL